MLQEPPEKEKHDFFWMGSFSRKWVNTFLSRFLMDLGHLEGSEG